MTRAFRMAKATRLRPVLDLERAGWMTTAAAAQYLGFGTCKYPIQAFWKFAKRQGIASVRRGRLLLFDPHDLDKAIGAKRGIEC
jgi:hypothetical protein